MSRNDTDREKSTAVMPPPEAEGGQLPLFSKEVLSAVRAEAARWRREVHEPMAGKKAAWKKDFTTVSGMETNPLATPLDVAEATFRLVPGEGTVAGTAAESAERHFRC